MLTCVDVVQGRKGVAGPDGLPGPPGLQVTSAPPPLILHDYVFVGVCREILDPKEQMGTRERRGKL